MDGADISDLNDLLVFGERLKLLAQLQASYLDELRSEGFDDDQAFQLVRDWSNRGFDWTVRWVPPAGSFEDQLRDVQHGLQPPSEGEQVSDAPATRGGDPSVASGNEPYLLPFDEQGLDEAA